MRAKKLIAELESRYGVHPSFSGQLMPVLERLADLDASAVEWDEIMKGVARAYRATADAPVESESLREVSALVGQFSTELRKLDESMKVLSAYLERIGKRVQLPPTRILH